MNIVVHTHGRVASRSIVDFVERAGVDHIVHAHRLQNPTIDGTMSIQFSKVGAIEDMGGKKEWKVISAVRDPVARNLSAFFANVYNPSMKDWQEEFLVDYPHRQYLEFFDREIRPFWGVDVYEEIPMYSPDRVYGRDKLIVMRVEDMWDQVRYSYIKFLDALLVFTEDTVLMGLQGRLTYPVKEVKLPESYLNGMYRSKFAKYFYTEEEIEGFMKRWTDG